MVNIWGILWVVMCGVCYVYLPQYLTLHNAAYMAAFVVSLACSTYLYSFVKQWQDKRLLKLKVRQNRRAIAKREAKHGEDQKQAIAREQARKTRLSGLMEVIETNRRSHVKEWKEKLSDDDRNLLEYGNLPMFLYKTKDGFIVGGNPPRKPCSHEEWAEATRKHFAIFGQEKFLADDMGLVRFVECQINRYSELRKQEKEAERKDAEVRERRQRVESKGLVFTKPMTADFFNGIFKRFANSSENKRVEIYNQYLEFLDHESTAEEMGLIYDQLGQEGRVCMLSRLVLSRGTETKDFAAVRFDKSDIDRDIYCFFASTGFINLKAWRDALPTICKYLGGKWTVREDDGTKIFLIRHSLPEVIPMTSDHLKKGALCVGYEFETSRPHWISLEAMTHMLVVGKSGMGKSVFLNQLVRGLLHNMEHVERCFMVDLKGGVELFPYEAQSEKISVIYRYEQLGSVVSELVQIIHERLEQMRSRGQKTWLGQYTFLIVDEYAQIQMFRSPVKEEKEAHARLLADLNIISMLGRAAGIRIIAQLQQATDKNMDTAFRNNLLSQVVFRVRDNLSAALIFGTDSSELPAKPTSLQRGEFIMYDETTGETFHGKACKPSDDVTPSPAQLTEK